MLLRTAPMYGVKLAQYQLDIHWQRKLACEYYRMVETQLMPSSLWQASWQ